MTSSAGATPADPQRTVVHLLRHGEVHNPHHVLYGRLPGYHLSALGRRMADLAAEHLADHDAHGLDTTVDARVVEAGNAFEGLPVAGGRGLLRHPRLWPKMLNPLRPSWGEPYTEIVERMRAAIVDARAAARGHEAVVVSHQAPIWMIRLATEGRPLVHNPARRECTLASLTSLTFLGDELLSLSYSEPAASLLPQAQSGAGA